MKKKLKISKKIYVSPLVEFEEIEQDELDMLMISQTDGDGEDYGESPETDPDPTSTDFDFTMDFVINDVPQ